MSAVDLRRIEERLNCERCRYLACKIVSDGQNGRGEIIVGVRLRGEQTAAPVGDTPHTRPTRDARHDGPDRHTEHTESQTNLRTGTGASMSLPEICANEQLVHLRDPAARFESESCERTVSSLH